MQKVWTQFKPDTISGLIVIQTPMWKKNLKDQITHLSQDLYDESEQSILNLLFTSADLQL